MKSGLLTGKMIKERAESLSEDDWRGRARTFNEPQLSKNLELVELLREIGACRPDQVDGVVGPAELKSSDDEVGEIEAFLAESY